jgi:hypothetical protein
MAAVSWMTVRRTWSATSGSVPEFADYLSLAFWTATAFSPTDISATKQWAKLLMTIEAWCPSASARWWSPGRRTSRKVAGRQQPRWIATPAGSSGAPASLLALGRARGPVFGSRFTYAEVVVAGVGRGFSPACLVAEVAVR